MAKKCAILGTGIQAGNNVSKSNRKTRRRFMPNLQDMSVYSEILGAMVNVRMTTRALRTIEKNGGLDAYLLNKPVSKLSDECKKLRMRLESAKAAKAI